MEHKLPELPFEKNAFAPVISAETFDYHYGKHHAAYVANLNKLIKGTEFEDMELLDIVKKAKGPVYNNAAQHWNHSFFWKCIKPSPSEELDEGFMVLVDKSFGSIGELKSRFIQAATSLFGSGWVWLVDNMDETLSIISSPNAGNPVTEGKKPLLVLDVWEHAYYIDFRNRRPDYAEAFWKIIDWGFVMSNHRMKVKA
jgi:superoxide dismutase, Fe-Mn family